MRSLLDPDRQVADALARRVVDRAGDRGGSADIAQFARPLTPAGLTASSTSGTRITLRSLMSALTGTR